MKPLEHKLTTLLDWLCIQWGFCLPPKERDRIAKCERWDAQEFALAVVTAEGFPAPAEEIEWLRQIRNRFIEYFGASVVSVEEFQGDEA